MIVISEIFFYFRVYIRTRKNTCVVSNFYLQYTVTFSQYLERSRRRSRTEVDQLKYEDEDDEGEEKKKNIESP